MRTIALMNQKGGVGKTTTTANLGAALAELNQRVCLIDLDPQAHLSINYGVDPADDVIGMYEVLVEDRSFLEAVHKIEPNVALAPSSIDLAAAEVELVSVVGRETLLKEKLDTAQHDFDLILLDCPPSLGILTINALAVADEVIIPMQPHFLALQGVAKLLETVQLVNRRVNPKLKVAGIVLTMFDAQTKLSNEVVAELEGFIEQAKGKPLPWAGAKIYQTRIRRNIKLAECPSFGQTIIKYDPSSNGAADYRALAREVLGIERQHQATKTQASTTAVRPVATVEKAVVAAKSESPPPRLVFAPPKLGAAPRTPSVAVTVNPSIDQARLAAARPATAKPAPAKPAAAPVAPDSAQEVASLDT